MPRLPITDRPIRAFVCDIDGCLSQGSTPAFRADVLAALRRANQLSRTDPAWPAITFCTGRTMPYVECLVQATDGRLPAICENGTVMFEPTRYEVTLHAGLGDVENEALREMRGLIDARLMLPGVQHEHGKGTHFTLVTRPPATPDHIVATARELAAGFDGLFIVEPTRTCVHLTFRHLHKGTGIEWLAEATGIDPEEMAGIGDARPDLPFLARVGIACAPGNAHPDVRAACHWHSDAHDGGAALEFLDRIVARNRALLGSGPAENDAAGAMASPAGEA